MIEWYNCVFFTGVTVCSDHYHFNDKMNDFSEESMDV